MSNKANLWQMAAHNWNDFEPPLCPSPQDVEYVLKVIKNQAAQNEILETLMLGVTPQLAQLDLPGNTTLLAVDQCLEMIDCVWPDLRDPCKKVLLANWLDMPLKNHSRDLIFGDGPFGGGLRFPNEYHGLLQSVRRILKPDGLFVFRIFIKPVDCRKPADVYKAAMAGKFKSFDAFQLLLKMSLQSDSVPETRYGEVWKSWSIDGPSWDELASTTGWSTSKFKRLVSFRDSDAIFSSPTLREFRNLLQDEGFNEVESFWPSYELGEQCPTFVCAPTNT